MNNDNMYKYPNIPINEMRQNYSTNSSQVPYSNHFEFRLLIFYDEIKFNMILIQIHGVKFSSLLEKHELFFFKKNTGS